ncbi:MAG: 4-(cytidine 5'-diphospho)-2-C-methyl-D-erythritol kinase [Candidatus Marinimicrobia bacterium]|nr:4-(cytidine 5'-diphospho)-2-C-methyl-D-erythritol kinase [Candidatus Neomarinimicrobiota bacterium]MCF7903519.1 4-(cytidine 5'-diphospho)-2-C-methyl-D-erythritol kinase [Candidatus Neomarinimicrobiota bacterium]
MSQHFTPFSLDAHTKVNLGLRVLGKRPDGYHELDTVFLQLDWGDTLHFAPSDTFRFATTGVNLEIGGQNICEAAYHSFTEAAGIELPLTIALDKIVPPGSGLGGGSADAAAVLRGLNQIVEAPLDPKQLESIALKLGADVPFFLKGGLQHGTGIGERLEPKALDFEGVFLLVIPPIHISTKQAFEALKIPLTAHPPPITFGRLLDKATLVRFFENEFESVVFHMHPEIGTIKQELLKQGAYFASLSGSGSTVYGIFDSLESAQAAQLRFINRYHTLTTHPRI